MEDQELSTPILAADGEEGIGDDPESPADSGGLKPEDDGTATDYESFNNSGKSQGKTTDAIAEYESHFTLRIPTSTVHFRGSVLRVIDTDQDQIILQQGTSDGDGKRDKVLVKRLLPGTYAQRFLRVGYTLITILFLGFLFVFCFQVLLFLFIALPVDSEFTSGSSQVKIQVLISTLLSFPVMMYGMASFMGEFCIVILLLLCIIFIY